MSRTNWKSLHLDTSTDLRNFYPKWFWRLSATLQNKALAEARTLPDIYIDPLRGTIPEWEVDTKSPDYNRSYWTSAWKANHEDGYAHWHWYWEKRAGTLTKPVLLYHR